LPLSEALDLEYKQKNIMNIELLRGLNISIEVLDLVDAVILVMDKDGRIVLFNKASENMTGFEFKEVANKVPWDLFILPEEVDDVQNVFSQLTAGNFPNKHTNYWVAKDKSKHLIDWSNTAITDKNGEILYIIATGIDITEKKSAEDKINNHINILEETVSKRTTELTKANHELENLVNIDGLTNIFNRRYFNDVIEIEIERGKRSNKPLSLLLCDIDYFKNYNDTYGHVAGDNCLIRIATILNNFFNRAADFVCRYGGEEFVIILPGIDSKSALDLAKKLIIEIQNNKLPHESSSASGVVTISMGLVTRQPDELKNSKSLIRDADKALYQAKANGRNQVRLYSDDSQLAQ
jgi:diguanylate cyclase (GGDEF)-like protein/PAS domain S-box-containing protein